MQKGYSLGVLIKELKHVEIQWWLYFHLEDQKLQLVKSTYNWLATYYLLSRCSQEIISAEMNICTHECGGYAHYITMLSLLPLEQQSTITLWAMWKANALNFFALNTASMSKYLTAKYASTYTPFWRKMWKDKIHRDLKHNTGTLWWLGKVLFFPQLSYLI